MTTKRITRTPPPPLPNVTRPSPGPHPAITTGDIAPPPDPIAPPPHEIPELHVRYCNRNPNPSTICALCQRSIGRVYPISSAPSLPRHNRCFCYYEATSAPISEAR